MLERESIQIESATGQVEGDRFVVRVLVRNTGDRTLYAYGSPRRVEYDNATGRLRIQLHDHGYPANEEKPIENHLKEPHVVPLEGGTTTELKVKLAPTMQRIRPAMERGDGPLFEELRVSEAKDLEIEIAHQDTPFYFNPKESNLSQLRKWGKLVATARFELAPRKSIR